MSERQQATRPLRASASVSASTRPGRGMGSPRVPAVAGSRSSSAMPASGRAYSTTTEFTGVSSTIAA